MRADYIEKLVSAPPREISRFFFRSHPAVKILSLCVISLSLNLSTSLLGCTVVGSFALIGALVVAPSRHLVGFLLIPAILVISLSAALQFFLADRDPSCVGLYLVGLVGTAALSAMVFFTTPILDLAHGLDMLMRPFTFLGLASRQMSLGLVISVRLVFLTFRSFREIQRAYEARGMSLGGLSGIRRFTLAVLLRIRQSVVDLSMSLISRGVDFSTDWPLTIKEYRTWPTFCVLALSGVALLMIYFL